ncbi:MAG: His-Xaa-Ser system radical SAM maturase HxsB [Myxococcales bacterium]|nr:MAG: His-Xaa-Ser system radical SAM maturase HxsB [Myxococcales bacterium]
MVAVKPQALNKNLTYIRFRKLDDGVLVTNDVGRFLYLSEEQFKNVVQGKVGLNPDLVDRLFQNHFLYGRGYAESMAAIFRTRHAFLNSGPNLHIVILTLRCNHTCQYCHASREPMTRTEFDMSVERARTVVDTIFQATSPTINVEFQGGEPLANWEALKAVVEYAEEKNKEARKDLAFTLVSNLSLMDEDKLAFLIAHNVYVCTSLDGPKELHEKNRICSHASSFDATQHWIGRFHEEYKARGYDLDVFHVDALMTTTRYSLPFWKEVIDTYVALGLKTIHLRPLNPFGFAAKTWERIGYANQEFIDFYKRAFDYVVELNLGGTELIERMAAIYLTRILTDRDPNYMELRSPCGAGIGQVAYNYDGRTFTCDEGRMMAQMGDTMFQMGEAGQDDLTTMLESDPVRTLVVASTQDGLPHCSTCAYKPYCGVCPIYNYMTQGDLMGQMPTNGRCQLALATCDHLFRYLNKDNEAVLRIFNRWVAVKQRQISACEPY